MRSLRLCCILAVIWNVAVMCAAAQSSVPLNPTIQPGGSPSQAAIETETYKSWIARFRQGPLNGGFAKDHTTKFAITIFEGDDLEAANPSKFPGSSRLASTTFSVSSDGTVSMQRGSAEGVQGGGPGDIPTEDFKRLSLLMSDLPVDHSQLPPKGHRLVAQLQTRDGIVARVYDRANLPEGILEMLRLIGADAWPIWNFPRFDPDAHWKSSEVDQAEIPTTAIGFRSNYLKLLATDPKRGLTVIDEGVPGFDSTVDVKRLTLNRQKTYDPRFETVLRIQDANTGSTIHEMREPMDGKSMISMYAARFTPDGRYLLVLSDIPDIRIYDTATWQPVGHIRGVPDDAVAYYPSTDWKVGVAAFKSGEVDLVEAKNGRKLVQIDFGEELESASFSPDGSQVAVVTDATSTYGMLGAHLRIWNTKTGKLLHELRALEATPHSRLSEPLWWPEGKYILSSTRESQFGSQTIVGIWNVESGRYRGSLSGCPIDEPWTQVFLSGSRVFKSCGTEILMWNVADDLKKLAEIEDSLPN